MRSAGGRARWGHLSLDLEQPERAESTWKPVYCGFHGASKMLQLKAEEKRGFVQRCGMLCDDTVVGFPGF